jgi:hypothetical protein
MLALFLVQVISRSQCLFSEVDLVPLLEKRLYIILIWGGPLGSVFHPQHIPTLVLHIKDTPFYNTFSFEGLIFVSLRQASESLGGLSFSLLHLHILKFHGNSPN